MEEVGKATGSLYICSVCPVDLRVCGSVRSHMSVLGVCVSALLMRKWLCVYVYSPSVCVSVRVNDHLVD